MRWHRTFADLLPQTAIRAKEQNRGSRLSIVAAKSTPPAGLSINSR
jgi:hypothetical protein